MPVFFAYNPSQKASNPKQALFKSVPVRVPFFVIKKIILFLSKGYQTKPYSGKEYGDREAKEVMTMSMEAVLGVTNDKETLKRFSKIMNEDRELANLVVGLLLKWRPL